jgi:hypothetical protein
MLFRTILASFIPLALVSAPPTPDQNPPPPVTTPVTSTFTQAQLDQMAAPIALYPDTLISHVLMAATYPVEIVQADRWISQNPGLTGKSLEEALTYRDWDPSVKALCGVPTVLERMSDNLDWTQDLGDAFLQQRDELMNTIQSLRAKATSTGALKSSDEMKVTHSGDVVVIESAQPEVVYVPTYYPVAVYGPGWYYDSWYYPSFFVAAPVGFGFVHFGAGFFWGVNLWGGCDWHHHAVFVHTHPFNDFCARTCAVPSQFILPPQAANQVPWQHDPAHRKGAGYRSSGVTQQFGAVAGARRITRDQARGFDGSDAQPERPFGPVLPESRAANPNDTTRRSPAEPLPAPRRNAPDSRPIPPVRERVDPTPRPSPPAPPAGVPRPVPRPIPPHMDLIDAGSPRSRISAPADNPPLRRSSGMSGLRDPQFDRAAQARGAASRSLVRAGPGSPP